MKKKYAQEGKIMLLLNKFNFEIIKLWEKIYIQIIQKNNYCGFQQKIMKINVKLSGLKKKHTCKCKSNKLKRKYKRKRDVCHVWIQIKIKT